MGLGASAPLFLRNGDLLGHSPVQIHSSLNSLKLVIISRGSTFDNFFLIYEIFQLNYIIDIAEAYIFAEKKGLKAIYFYIKIIEKINQQIFWKTVRISPPHSYC